MEITDYNEYKQTFVSLVVLQHKIPDSKYH